MPERGDGPGGRVRVTSPLTSAAAPHGRRSARQEIDEETGVGDVYVRSLVSTQLRSALAVVAALARGLGSLPLVFALAPAVAAARLGPVPLPGLLLGVVVYPTLLALGWVYVRRSERAESDFTDLVDPRSVEDVPR
ncbi:hypothetical protein [Aeromicrobium sp.]|uniref:hypothetical protein n=1 Tax=Aeromicrobium sp. TaxID=1871063 RepID=UPI0035155FF9